MPVVVGIVHGVHVPLERLRALVFGASVAEGAAVVDTDAQVVEHIYDHLCDVLDCSKHRLDMSACACCATLMAFGVAAMEASAGGSGSGGADASSQVATRAERACGDASGNGEVSQCAGLMMGLIRLVLA